MSRIFLAFLLLAGTGALCSPPSPSDAQTLSTRGPSYVGAERCGGCHPAAYDVWQKSAHARAHLSLPPQRRGDPKCTGCHSPDPGAAAPGVQCESCHGAGRDYSFDFAMKDPRLARLLGLTEPGERRCRVCHVADGLPRFDYAAKLRAIVHGSR
jgi:hypothetical protein